MTLLPEPIASPRAGTYLVAMTAVVRLLTLIALVLMPFTMTTAPAEAHGMPGMTSSEHCGEHSQPVAPSAPDLAQCMLMCAALPAGEPLTIRPVAVPKAPRFLTFQAAINGIVLEIATPPPRMA